MSSTPVVLYQLYCEVEENQSFSVQRSSTSVLESMLRSRFISRENGLLVLNRGFHDLADRKVVADLKRNRNTLRDFSERLARSHTCDLIMVLNTHASALDGGLLYGNGKSTSLPAMVEHVLGDRRPTDQFRRSILFVVCCGGFVEHSMEEMREIGHKFSAVLAFGAPALDPILVMSQFVCSVADYFILGQEDLWPAIRHSLKQEVMKHTSVYVAKHGDIYRVSDAPLRRRPNGVEVRCCRQLAKYMGCDRTGKVIKFRCQVPNHAGPRVFRVEVHVASAGHREIWGGKGGPRYLLERVTVVTR
ncbi:hypothetical protein K466DRAFT_504806 [Polyporus arcularius HHB13444]|uniref:Caspase family p20 domain-containing protein n=1 Tax=Polyporus arcularius HHB13444 TaxID=1314778 RepID=A0A5C3NQR9_9APHY|nr:hypothetical protein K466DRAFT_504806 [Polyporus arcularius HHB13444]